MDIYIAIKIFALITIIFNIIFTSYKIFRKRIYGIYDILFIWLIWFSTILIVDSVNAM